MPPPPDRAGSAEGVGAGAAQRATAAQDAWYAANAARWESESGAWRLAEAAFEGIAVSEDGIVADVNRAFCEKFGYNGPEQMRGLSADSLVAEGWREVVRRKIAERDESPYEVVAVRRDGGTFEAEVRGRAIEVEGRTARITAVRDVSARNEARRALLKSQARLAEAQAVARIGSWSLEVATGEIEWSDELFRIFGMDPAEGEPSYGTILARTHPDDAEAHAAATRKGLADGEPYELDLRIGGRQGGYRWAHAAGRGEKDTAGSVVRLFGTLTDVHERKLLEAESRRRAEALASSEARFRVLFERSSDPHLLFDGSGVIDCNPAAVRLLRCEDASQVLSIHPAALSPEFQPDGRRSDEKCVEMDALARRNGVHRFEWTHRKFDGEDFPVEVSLTHVMLGERDVLLTVWHDLTERKRAERQIADYAALLEAQRDELDERLLETAEMNVLLEAQRYQLEAANARLSALATTDGLTGLLNHRAFQERLGVEVERSRRTGEPVGLVLMDVDRFKAFNDRHGHPAGDAVLRAVAAALGAGARNTDVVARYGGEEFAVILPAADSDGALDVAERLRLAVEAISLDWGPVTASFGVAALLPAMGQEELIEAADRAMYRSKEGGRNRTTKAPGGESPVSPPRVGREGRPDGSRRASDRR